VLENYRSLKKSYRTHSNTPIKDSKDRDDDDDDLYVDLRKKRFSVIGKKESIV